VENPPRRPTENDYLLREHEEAAAMSKSAEFVIKRVYEDASRTDGLRVLVDRLWPRGLTKASAHLDDWRQDLAPSPTLRKWFGHDPERFPEFSARYEKELAGNKAVDPFLLEVVGKRVSLLYAAKDSVVNHANVLQRYLMSRHRGPGQA
jgi:uncharacterized protein YeaO (DUF488 family)